MKRIISVFLATLIMLSLCFTSAYASTYVKDNESGFLLEIYGENDSTYLVAGYEGGETSVVLPSTAFGKPVVGVASDFGTNCGNLSAVEIPDTYTLIESFAFFENTSLTEITVPSSVNSIGAYAFASCSALLSADLSACSVASVPSGCFSGSSNLASVNFPQNVSSIKDYAFSGTALTQLNVPSTVRSVGKSAFANCSQLGEVVLSDGVESIGDEAFSGCPLLATIQLPYSLTSIGASAFSGAVLLEEIFIPHTVESIGAYAFYPEALQDGTLKIRCLERSYAAQYAYENFLNFETDNVLFGDVDQNGVVDINDVTYIQLFRLGRYEFQSPVARFASDTTHDGEVTLRDATMIQLFKAGMVDSM